MVSTHWLVLSLVVTLSLLACQESESPLVADRLAVIDEAAQQAADYKAPGKIEKFTYASGDVLTGDLDYLIYTPTTYNSRKLAPLVVVLHGCTTTADNMMASSAMHPTAEREGFIVVYPDVPLSSRLFVNCWKFPDPNSQVRDSGDPALIAGVTRDVMQRMSIDPERVYLIGMSSGAVMTGIMGATYPDIFAAIAENAGCAYKALPCLGAGGALSQSDQLGQQAYQAMGQRARVMPVLQLRGDQDTTVPPSNSPQVIEQWIATNNYVLSGTATAPFDTVSDEAYDGVKSDGYAYTVNRYRDSNGCLLIEDWMIHGMGHYFSGGSSDPSQSIFTDPKGPMMAEIAWRFLNRYRLSDFTSGYRPSVKACS